jgi:uncharacterized protein
MQIPGSEARGGATGAPFVPAAPSAQGAVPATTHLLYLHGFRSSPQSAKARRLAAWMAAEQPGVHWWCPPLPPSPREAMALLEAGTQDWPAGHSAVVGSSLGGFYATALAETAGRGRWRVGLINPAVDPARDLERHIGEQRSWHDPDERFYFEPGYVAELRALAPGVLSGRERYLPIIATGDEVLDWREMTARYAGEPLHLVQGSDHGLSDFDTHLPRLLQHLHLG